MIVHLLLCLCFGLALASLRFDQVIEEFNCLSSENRYFHHNLSRPSALNWKDSLKCSDVSRYRNPFTAEAGACDKCNVRDHSLVRDGVSTYGNKLQRNYHLSSRKETPKNDIIMFRSVSELTSVSFKIDKIVRTS